MKEWNRYAIYASVFPDEIAQRSTEEQIRYCHTELEPMNDIQIVGEYCDEAIAEERPGLVKLFADIDIVGIEMIVVTDVVRLAPYQIERVQILDRMSAVGIGIAVVVDGFMTAIRNIEPYIPVISNEKWPTHMGMADHPSVTPEAREALDRMLMNMVTIHDNDWDNDFLH